MLPRGAAAAGALILLLAMATSCGVPVGIRTNQHILEDLPQFPGAERLSVTSDRYYEGAEGPYGRIPVGYSTEALYMVPSGTTPGEVVDFYVDNLPDGWRYKTNESLGTLAVIARSNHIQVGVSVDTEGLADDGRTIRIRVTPDLGEA
jgi:hypothetical protein